jgi:hypothetical protein
VVILSESESVQYTVRSGVFKHRVSHTILSTNQENLLSLNRESNNMGLVPGNFDPDYSVEEINSRLTI